MGSVCPGLEVGKGGVNKETAAERQDSQRRSSIFAVTESRVGTELMLETSEEKGSLL